MRVKHLHYLFILQLNTNISMHSLQYLCDDPFKVIGSQPLTFTWVHEQRKACPSKRVSAGLYSSFIANHVPGAKAKPCLGAYEGVIGNPPHLSCKSDCWNFKLSAGPILLLESSDIIRTRSTPFHWFSKYSTLRLRQVDMMIEFFPFSDIPTCGIHPTAT